MNRTSGPCDADSPRRRPAIRPRDAASLVITDCQAGVLRVLLGKRRKEQAFAPSNYVFPGGSVDEADERLEIGTGLDPLDAERLLFDVKGCPGPARARAFALAAIRETYEETGLVIGQSGGKVLDPPSDAWRRFLAHGFLPDTGALTFLARAITPPGRTRRFDARFFWVPASAISLRSGVTDEEFLELVWATLEEARALNLHSMTRTILDDLEARLGADLRPVQGAPVPYYYSRRGEWQRTLITGLSQP